MKQLVAFLLIISVMLPASLLYAQDDHPVQLPTGQTITLPLGWEVEEQDAVYIFWANEADFIKFMSPENVLPYYANLPDTPTLAELLIILVEEEVTTAISDEDITITDGSAEFTRIEEGIQYSYRVFEWNGGFLYQEIVASMDNAEAMIAVADDLIAQLAQCFIHTDQRWGVPLRLGPNASRSEYTSLTPADGALQVLAQHTAADGSRWWQVAEDYEAVSELWVADADVITSGRCELVDEYGGQPVIPPQNVPPVVDNAGSGATTDAGLIPASGTWYWAVSPTMAMSCEGTRTIQAQTPDRIFLEGNVSLVTSADGTTVTVSGTNRTVNFTGANGYYVAEIQTPNRYVQAQMYVSAPTVMTVEISIALLNRPRPCSGSLTIATTYIG